MTMEQSSHMNDAPSMDAFDLLVNSSTLRSVGSEPCQYFFKVE
jgi:hypothetical protein